MQKDDKEAKLTITVLLIVAFIGWYYWPIYAPAFGDYRLRSGHFACPSEDEVVVLRGARLFGTFQLAYTASRSDCISGPRPVNVKKMAARGNLISKVEVNGQTLYVDHNGLAKTDQ